MCSYNRVNGDYACENKYLLTDVLKKEWKFKGFVLSDWGGTHSTAKASAAGLDHEEPGRILLRRGVSRKLSSPERFPWSELDDHVQRILRSMFATGVIDRPAAESVVDVMGGFEVARKIEEAKHRAVEERQKPAAAGCVEVEHHRGDRCTFGCGNDLRRRFGAGRSSRRKCHYAARAGPTHWQDQIWFPTSPLKAIKARPRAQTCNMIRAPIPRQPRLRPSRRTWRSSSLISGRARAWIWRPLSARKSGRADCGSGEPPIRTPSWCLRPEAPYHAVGGSGQRYSRGLVCRQSTAPSRRKCAVRRRESQRQTAHDFSQE